jgi:hypothetical protein
LEASGLPSLVGREHELARLEELLGSAATTGPAGGGGLDQPDHFVASTAERITLTTSARRVIGVR